MKPAAAEPTALFQRWTQKWLAVNAGFASYYRQAMEFACPRRETA
jgi:hypothetical protein